MKILVDIGNTHTEFAQLSKNTLLPIAVFPTFELQDRFNALHFEKKTEFYIASVIPKMHPIFQDYPLLHFINYSLIPTLKIDLPQPDQIGIDRLLTALGAYTLIQGACLIIDSGTATTLNYVDETATFQGGIILPGFDMATKALHQFTAQIPMIKIEPDINLVGKNTKEAVQIGLFQGMSYALNGFIASFKQKKVTVIGTGTGLSLIKDSVNLDQFEPNLLMIGLKICALTL